MILYDLKCERDHHFEAWFRDSAAYDEQAAAGEVHCPLCGGTRIAKAPMAPNLVGRKEETAASAAAIGEAIRMLHKMREEVEKNCEHVGPRFAEEARKIHYGEVEKRNIYGEATSEEAGELREEGIEFGEIPWLPRRNA